MKRSAIVGVFFGLLLAISTVVGATTGAGTSKLERQTFQFRVGPVSTSSRAWRNIPGLRLDICAQHEESFVASLNLSGAPVLIKIGGLGIPTSVPGASPGPARFVPGTLQRTFTAFWAGKATSFEGNFAQALAVQWRSPTGGTVTLSRGIVNAMYELGEPYGAGPCSNV